LDVAISNSFDLSSRLGSRSRKRRLIVQRAQWQLQEPSTVPAAAAVSKDASLAMPAMVAGDELDRVDVFHASEASTDLVTTDLKILSGRAEFAASDSEDDQRGVDFQPLRELLSGSKPVAWVFAGDSITQGALYTGGQRSYSEHFAERVRWGLRRDQDVVINTSAPDETSQSLLEDLEWRTLRFQPDVVSMMIGINDATAGHMGRSQFRRNLQHIVGCIRAEGALVLLHTPPRVDLARLTTHVDLRAYVRILRDLARELDVPCVDHWAFWKNAAAGGENINDWLVADGLHPTGEGHRVLAKLLFTRLGILNERARPATR
jgi:acyl-CoA thioesterase-1